MITPQVQAAFQVTGFALLKGSLPVDVVSRVREDARQVFLNQMAHLGIPVTDPLDEAAFLQAMSTLFRDHRQAFINCGKTAQHLISLHRLGVDERLVGAVTDFGQGTPNICTRPVLYFNHRNLAEREVFYKTPAHQDWSSMQGSLNALIVWVPLCPIDVPLGAIEVVPGSHLWGLQPYEDDYGFGKINGLTDEIFQPVTVEAGDIVVFSAFLVHRSGDNVTNRLRWSCHFRYNDLNEPTFVERQYPNPYLYKPLPDLVTPGFPAPAHLNEYYRQTPNAQTDRSATTSKEISS